jgi:hypothetical protein
MDGYKQKKTDLVWHDEPQVHMYEGLLKAVATELANYKLDFEFVEEFRLNKVWH